MPGAKIVGQGRTRLQQGRAGQGRAGQGRAGQGRAGQGRAGQGRAGQGRAGQGRAEQGRATCSEAEAEKEEDREKQDLPMQLLGLSKALQHHVPHLVTVCIHPAFIFSRETCTVTVLEWCLWALHPLCRICAISFSPCCIAAACWGVRVGNPMPG